MLDQMFTAETFRVIFDEENRKGYDPAGRFFPSVEPYTEAVKSKIHEIRKINGNAAALPNLDLESAIDIAKNDLKKLKLDRSAVIDAELRTVSSNAAKSSFRITLKKKVGPKGKPIYVSDDSPESYFVIKQVQRNIKRIYAVKQSNRNEMAAQVARTLSTDFPFEVVRTDIRTFYESVDRKKLIRKIDDDQLLSTVSKNYIKQTLDAYGVLSGSAKGIPRGIGLSAFLGELALRPVDNQIRSLPGVVLYCRYVDDILAVFARPVTGKEVGSYQDLVVKGVEKCGLTTNPDKTQSLVLGSSKPAKFTYLGYRFAVDSKGCSIRPSATKFLKYKRRVQASFEQYDRDIHVSAKKAYRNLVARVRFLTTNARLLNNKASATVGIYYGNPLVNDLVTFRRLDKMLKKRVEGIRRKALRNRLKLLTFTNGFVNRPYSNFTTQELSRITKAWRDE
ncbi:antiviral reverse transcriptase Drt3a [Sphingomonas sp. R86520]|uniref:antiviral reverse transcriptase Drt3a n=1 Tax=Sphingomonas sp. R86520 TaxID=3093859 RepID=UPI0036D2B9B2